MKRRVIQSLSVMLFLTASLVCLPSWEGQGANPRAPYEQKSSPYFRKPSGYWRSNDPGKTLGGGLKKIFLGWTEIVTEPVESVQEGENPALGVARGLRDAVVETADGVYETLTFPFD